MAFKAIKVTNENQEQLNSRFFQDGPGVPVAVGYYLVVLFGSEDYDLLSAAKFNEHFTVGEPLYTAGWFEAIKKE